ncbi:MAG: flagellar hook protein FlgE [Phenylobacterium sp.]|jgi:flagellar hook protein FlgE
MFQAFFTGLSGLFSFSKNLDSVSNNIANMNTPGFRGQDTFYRSLSSGDQGTGYGTQVSGQGYRFSEGDVRQTGNATDMAIAGNGFFVLRDGDNLLYTRAGQFAFNDQGILTDSVSGLEVGAINANGQIESLDISTYRALAPESTSEVTFSGNLSQGAAEHSINGLTVYNALGEAVEVNLKFTNEEATLAGSWTVAVTDKDGVAITTNTAEIRFGTDGTPLAGFTGLSFNLTDSLGGTSTVALNFGTSGDITGSTSTDAGTTSTLQGTVTDGSPIAVLTGINFAADGVLKLSYNNGKVNDGPVLALANFTNDSALKLVDGSIFSAGDVSGRSLGQPGQDSLGSLVAQSIELSNVDLSREFADMIIIQRGYQASSRILNVANQMLEQLYDSTRGR